KGILQTEVMERLDHRHLNYEVPELSGQIPTCENMVAMIWRLLEPKITKGKLERVRVYESQDLYADCTAEVEAGRAPEQVAVGAKETISKETGRRAWRDR
ncbi:MAG TPA: 6-carboxytetrahydropterin synthase, partial [Candidatus Acidoferrales bacterium]|nr:6-carboxytetrahydropterin synthase [Candidatus Acidoferrales bacterium]